MHFDANSNPQSHDTRPFVVRAELLGGRADGRMLSVAELAPQIAVYQNGRGLVARPPAPADVELPGLTLLGLYELVGDPGPETPVYVASA